MWKKVRSTHLQQFFQDKPKAEKQTGW